MAVEERVHQTGVIHWVTAHEEMEERGHHDWEDGRRPVELNPPSLSSSEESMDKMEVWEWKRLSGPGPLFVCWPPLMLFVVDLEVTGK